MCRIRKRGILSADFNGDAVEDIRVAEQIRIAKEFIVNEIPEDTTEYTPGVGPGQL